MNHKIEDQIVPKHVDERPSGVSIDWPVMQVKNSRNLQIDALFADFREYFIVSDEEGLGEIKSILFVNQSTKHWFYAHDTVPSSGMIIEAGGQTSSELLDAYEELLRLFRLKDSDVVWVSDFVSNERNGLSEKMPRFSQAH